MSAPYRYRAYGLRLQSDLALPALAPSDEPTVDTTITFLGHQASMRDDTSGVLVYPRASLDHALLQVWRTAEGGLRLRAAYRDEYCTFDVDAAGAHVRVAWSAVTPEQDVLLYLLGPVLGVVLRLRGATCLHGSAVCYQGRAAVLVGPKGAGKSTTAAALMARGCAMLTDDVAVVREHGGVAHVQPGYPGMRLRAAPAAHLFGAAEALPGLWSDAVDRAHVQRRYLDLKDRGEQYIAQAVPLTAVYVLGARDVGGGAARVVPLSRMDGLLTLAANAYADYALTDGGRAHEWRGLERLLRAVPARRLVRPEGLDALSAICDVLLDDLGALRLAAAEAP